MIPDLRGIKICQVSCGSTHSLALSDDGHVHAWGSNEFGQLGNGPNNSGQDRPRFVFNCLSDLAC